jgi:nitroreductase
MTQSHPAATAARQTETDVSPLFVQRWSPRAFTDEAIEEGELLRLLEAGRWAPSSMNNQPWRFIYALRGTPEWGPIHAALVPFNQEWSARAAALVVVLSNTQMVSPYTGSVQANRTHSFDAGAAWMSVALEATLTGWSTHAMSGVDFETLQANIAAPAEFNVEAVFAVGRQGTRESLAPALAEREVPSTRLPLAALAARGRFSFP